MLEFILERLIENDTLRTTPHLSISIPKICQKYPLRYLHRVGVLTGMNMYKNE